MLTGSTTSRFTAAPHEIITQNQEEIDKKTPLDMTCVIWYGYIGGDNHDYPDSQPGKEQYI